MIPEMPWRTVAEPMGRWLLRRLPAVVFTKYYNPLDLENDIKIRLQSERPIVMRPGKLRAPSLEIEGEVFNMSPYLDLHVTAVRSSLSADCNAGGDVFAKFDDWGGFDLPRGEPRPFMLTYWLNEFQMRVVSSCLDERVRMTVDVMLYADSRIGVARPFKQFYVTDPIVR